MTRSHGQLGGGKKRSFKAKQSEFREKRAKKTGVSKSRVQAEQRPITRAAKRKLTDALSRAVQEKAAKRPRMGVQPPRPKKAPKRGVYQSQIREAEAAAAKKKKAGEDTARKKRMDVQRAKYKKQKKKKGLPKIGASGQIRHYKDPKTGIVHALSEYGSDTKTADQHEKDWTALDRVNQWNTAETGDRVTVDWKTAKSDAIKAIEGRRGKKKKKK